MPVRALEIVDGGHNGNSLLVQLPKQQENFCLPSNIQVLCRLIKQKEFWSLCQRESNLDTLALTTAQLIEATTGQMVYTCEFHRSTYFDPVARLKASEE